MIISEVKVKFGAKVYVSYGKDEGGQHHMKREEWKLTNGCTVRISTELAAIEGTTEGQRIAEDQRGVVYRMMRRRFAANAKAREDVEYDGGMDDELV